MAWVPSLMLDERKWLQLCTTFYHIRSGLCSYPQDIAVIPYLLCLLTQKRLPQRFLERTISSVGRQDRRRPIVDTPMY